MRKKKETKNCGVFDLKTGKFKHSHLATDEQDFEKLYFETDIKPLLENKDAIEYLYNMPDIEQLKMYPDNMVPDEDFLEALKTKPIYLWSRFAREKIERWLQEKYSADADMAWKAQDKLKRIGESLAYKGHVKRQPNYHKETFIALERDKVYKAIKELKISKMRSEGGKRIELKKIFDGIDSLQNIPPTDAELADLITAKMHVLTPDTVKQYCKRCKKVEGHSAFVLKPSR